MSNDSSFTETPTHIGWIRNEETKGGWQSETPPAFKEIAKCRQCRRGFIALTLKQERWTCFCGGEIDVLDDYRDLLQRLRVARANGEKS